MALCLPLIADQRVRNVLQFAVPGSGTLDHVGDVRGEPFPQVRQTLLQSPCTRNHYFGSGHLPQRILQNGQSAEVLRFMAMLWVQDSIKIQKQYGRVDDSIPAFQQPLNFCWGFNVNETSWSWSFWSRWAEIGWMSSRKRVPPQADFGRALRQLRAARGLVQEDMLLATSRRHISRIEQGHQVPSVRTIEVLAEQMQIHPLTLVAVAYCPELDAASVSELLKTLKSDFKEIGRAHV